MTIDVDKAFEVTSGLIVNDRADGNTVEGPFYTGGPSTPIGLNLPETSIYVQTKADGIIVWRKFGNGINDWAVHDGLFRRDKKDHDITVPAKNSYQLHSPEIDKELRIDGEVYIL